MTEEQAATFHGHSAKRFLLNVADGAGSFDSVDSNQVGRFSNSTAQDRDLEPTQAMLSKHTLACSVLPAIYAKKSKVDSAFSLLARMHTLLVRVAHLYRDGQLELPLVDGWEIFRPF